MKSLLATALLVFPALLVPTAAADHCVLDQDAICEARDTVVGTALEAVRNVLGFTKVLDKFTVEVVLGVCHAAGLHCAAPTGAPPALP